MRRTLITLFILLSGSLLLIQQPPARGQNDAHLIPITPPANWQEVSNTAPIPVELTPLESAPDIFAPNSIGANSCEGAVALPLQFGLNNIMSDQTAVSTFSITDSDPNLSGCFNRPTTNNSGYRSVWYRFDNFTFLPNSIIPQDGTGINGRLVVRTEPNEDYRQNYDTVIAIYAGNDCDNLARLTCNDDHYALLSQASIPVVDGQRYYIQVVDFVEQVSGPLNISLVAEIIPNGSWSDTTEHPSLPQATSRHSVVMDGDQAYIIGGQIFGQQGFVERTGATYRYDTRTGQITPLADHPAGVTAFGAGYSNSDAVLLDGKIHMPSGNVGSPDGFRGTHWVYDIATNQWQRYSAADGQVDPPWGAPPGVNAPGFTQLETFATGNQRGLYVIGGLTGTFFAENAGASARLHRYVDGLPGFWQQLPSMNTPRYAHAAATLSDGRVCVVGGLSDGPALITNGECFFPDTLQWQPSVGDLNIPRYMAGSVVGPDGRWYVFGGYDAASIPVEEIEVFDPNTASWNVLGRNYHITAPPLGWVRGGFVGSTLWLFGGEQANNILVSQVQANPFPINPGRAGNELLFFPVVHRAESVGEPGQTLNTAVPLIIGLPHHHSFTQPGDVYHTYRFDLSQSNDVIITLGHIPLGSDYDILLYNNNKVLIAAGQNLGANPEHMTIPLTPGRYYVMVVRDAPPPAVPPNHTPYRLLVTLP